MARLPALIDAMTATLGAEREAVQHIARLLREAGAIRVTGHGRGASHMTLRDAANLLIGLQVPVSAARTPEAVEKYRALRLLHVDHTNPDKAFLPREVRQTETFGEAIEALIAMAGTVVRDLDTKAGVLYGPDWAEWRQAAAVGTFWSPLSLEIELVDAPSAKILVRQDAGTSFLEHHDLQFVLDADDLTAGLIRPSAHTRTQRQFDLAPVLALHEALLQQETKNGAF